MGIDSAVDADTQACGRCVEGEHPRRRRMRGLSLAALVALVMAHNAFAVPSGAEQLVDFIAEEVQMLEDDAKKGGAQKGVFFNAELAAGSTERMFYKGTKPAPPPAAAAPAAELGAAKGESAALAKAAKADDTNAALFDLVPVFKGIAADPIRRRSLVSNCVSSLKLWVTKKICKSAGTAKLIKKEPNPFPKINTGSGSGSGKKKGAKAKKGAKKKKSKKKKKKKKKKTTMLGELGVGSATGSGGQKCREWALSPMSDAMRSLWANAQKLFCKRQSDCDGSLCYTPPGPLTNGGLSSKPHHSLKNVPLNVFHNATLSGHTVVQQMASIDIKLEKINFCENVTPEAKYGNLPGLTQPSQCYTARRCQILNVKYGDCFDGTATSKTVMKCPDDQVFVKKLLKAQTSLAMALCNKV